MKLSIDSESTEEQQEILVGEIIANIAEQLEEVGLQGDVLKETTGKIAFKVACMLDGVSEVSFDGSEALQYVCFQGGDDTLVHLGGNTYMHELVYGILGAMFKDAS
ncbi:hypothetical protein OAG1_25240 [Agarivorans sp. OAG1]|uniref:hypothetical protein n=1 Tax=Agarivorans sp. OAG1 TaxID=3082387 RepID=UPI002B291248|nr:hypothetical protein OAG1_25240 [Agarivorans sp. OAG1]